MRELQVLASFVTIGRAPGSFVSLYFPWESNLERNVSDGAQKNPLASIGLS